MPPAVKEELRGRGVGDADFGKGHRVETSMGPKDRFVMLLALLIGLTFILALILGIARIGNWVWSLLLG